jgi:hypothetical protein
MVVFGCFSGAMHGAGLLLGGGGCGGGGTELFQAVDTAVFPCAGLLLGGGGGVGGGAELFQAVGLLNLMANDL